MNYRDFWEHGHGVFGLHGAMPDGKCACGNPHCKAIFKHPRVSNWQHTPIWSEEQIETMEMMDQFQTGYGVLCKRLLIVDVDARNGGVASAERLINDFPSVATAGLIVNTGSGGGSRHYYFLAPEGVALVSHLADYPGVDFRSGFSFVVGPGSLHASGRRYEIAYGSVEDIKDAPAELIALLAKPERHRAEFDGRTIDVSHQDLADMLRHVQNADLDYEIWIRIGMSLHDASGGTAFDVWDAWSATSSKYDASQMRQKWHSFGKSANPVTIGTLIHYAEQGGWQQSVEFVFEPPAEPEATAVDTSAIDLRRPPGFVGQVTDWINSQCRRPREHLAVAGALLAVGNLAGLRYTDDLDGVTTNLFVFCVAHPRTGKEAILQSVSAIHLAAGMHKAAAGSIKSEQEIIRNLVDHQAAVYVIDEIGYLLNKIKNAQTKGGASYLDGVIGTLMSVYSKANAFMLLTGDMKKEVRRAILNEIAQLDKQPPTPQLDARIAAAVRAVEGLDNGLEKPFLSLCGFTTPATFDNLVDFQSASTGFIGRALIFNERESTPKKKKRFRAPPMSSPMKMALAGIFNGGNGEMLSPIRIEHYEDRVQIPTTPLAIDLLDRVSDELEDLADRHKSTTGLESLALGAYELVAKISLILAVPGGLRTEEHVRWAYALVRRDVEEKANLVVGNDRAKDAPAIALRSKVLNLISGDEGEALGVLQSRLRGFKKDDIQKCLDAMVADGQATVEESVHKFNKRVTRKYKAK